MYDRYIATCLLVLVLLHLLTHLPTVGVEIISAVLWNVDYMQKLHAMQLNA